MFLSFDGLVQPVGIPAADHQTAGEFVHDHHFAVLHHIVHIPLHQAVGLQRLDQVMVQVIVFRVGQVFNAEMLFSLFGTLFGEDGRLVLFVHGIIGVLFQAKHKFVGFFVHVGGLVTLT